MLKPSVDLTVNAVNSVNASGHRSHCWLSVNFYWKVRRVRWTSSSPCIYYIYVSQ